MLTVLTLTLMQEASAQTRDCLSSWCRTAEEPSGRRAFRSDIAWAPGAGVGIQVWERNGTVYYVAFDMGGPLTGEKQLVTDAGRPRVAARDDKFYVVYESYGFRPWKQTIEGVELDASTVACEPACALAPTPTVISGPGTKEARPAVEPLDPEGGWAVAWLTTEPWLSNGGATNPPGDARIRLLLPREAPGYDFEPAARPARHLSSRAPMFGSLHSSHLFGGHSEPHTANPYVQYVTHPRPLVAEAIGNVSTLMFGQQDDLDIDLVGPTPATEQEAGMPMEPVVAKALASQTSAQLLMVWDEPRLGVPRRTGNDRVVMGQCIEVRALWTTDPAGPLAVPVGGPFVISSVAEADNHRPDAVYAEQTGKYLVAWTEAIRVPDPKPIWDGMQLPAADGRYPESPVTPPSANTAVRARWIDCYSGGGEEAPDLSESEVFYLENPDDSHGYLPRVTTDGLDGYVTFESDGASRGVWLQRVFEWGLDGDPQRVDDPEAAAGSGGTGESGED